MNVHIFGTNHLMSSAAITGIIKDEAPDIICLELCEFRAANIFNEVKEATENKTLLGKITDKIKQKAKEEGEDYGSDQKSALRYAQSVNLPYFLVDMPILKIQELFSKIPEKEQLGFAGELKTFESESIKTEVNEEEVLTQLKSRYPIAFEFLINMRNLYITNELLKVMLNNKDKRILVFLGKGHVKQIEKMILGGLV